MSRATARRRRIAIGVLAALAAVAFAVGAALGNRGGEAASERLVAAEVLTPAQLAGERLVAGVEGTAVSPRLRAAIRAAPWPGSSSSPTTSRAGRPAGG